MPIERLDTSAAGWIDDPRLADYLMIRDPELVKRSARFVAEGRLVVRTLLRDSAFEARSVLAEDAALTWLKANVDPAALQDVTTLVLPSGAMETLSGFRFHQGCLAVGVRPDAIPTATLLAAIPDDARVIVGLDALSNPDNVGAIFRSAAALGAGGVVLSPECASPLYRKAIRTSMGVTLRLPFSHGPGWSAALRALKDAGWILLALTPAEDALPLDAALETLPPDYRCALLLGAEGPGLGAASLELADLRVHIPMMGGMDSLNVAAAAAVALHGLADRGGA